VSAPPLSTLIQTCRLNDVDPHAWLAYVIATISDHSQTRLHDSCHGIGKRVRPTFSSTPKPPDLLSARLRPNLKGLHRMHTVSPPRLLDQAANIGDINGQRSGASTARDRRNLHVVTYNASLVALAHYGSATKACQPYRAKTKSKVARPFRYIRQDFFLGRSFRDLDDLNAQFHVLRADIANAKEHATTGRIMGEHFACG
jgi:hypothetical protein